MNVQLSELVNKCPTCNGLGHQPDKNRPVNATPARCDNCNGTGYRLTNLGTVLRDFVRLLETFPELLNPPGHVGRGRTDAPAVSAFNRDYRTLRPPMQKHLQGQRPRMRPNTKFRERPKNEIA